MTKTKEEEAMGQTWPLSPQEQVEAKLALFDELVEACEAFFRRASPVMEFYPWPGVAQPLRDVLARAKEVKA